MGKLNKKKHAMLKMKKKNELSSQPKNKLKKRKLKKHLGLPKDISDIEENIQIKQSVKTESKKIQGKKSGQRVSGAVDRQIKISNVTDIGLEELEKWNDPIKIEYQSKRKPAEKHKVNKSSCGFSHKKTKLDHIQEKQEDEYEIKETFKDVVNDLKREGFQDMNAWKNLFVPDPILKALAENKFTSPTPIQTLSLPSAIRDKMDIVGAAETGSGKTLAFGIPLINNILEYKKKMQFEEKTDESIDEDFSSDVDSDMESAVSHQVSDITTNQVNKSSDSDTSVTDEELSDAGIDDDSDNDDDPTKELPKNESVIIEGGEEVKGSEVEELFGCGVDSDAIGGGDEGVDDDYDMSPDEEDEEQELADDEIGCVRVVNNVEFDWVEKPKKVKAERNSQAPLLALILCPTRELAMQVAQHLQKVTKYTSIKIATVVGGMAVQKQQRILNKCPEIVVATPGRLWELLQEGQPHLSKVEFVRNLVIDEADRMVEKGHFQELTKLLDVMNSNDIEKKKRQTFVFSATLTMVHSGPERVILKKKKKQKFKKLNEKEKLEALMVQIGLQGKPKILDLTRKERTAETLVESRIVCDKNEKDLYLYYFKQQYNGRTLVFTNSKDCIRRLISIFTLLECDPLPLHSDMHQTQRLKNLDRFKEKSNGFLFATDVAARGLDIPDVQHVIHYQVPRTTENYVHRSGRTARANKEGLSVVLVSPEDLKNYRNIIKTLNRDEELTTFPVALEYLPSLKEQLKLALGIDKIEHIQVRQKKENSWFIKAAQDMDIELDEDQLLHDFGDSFEQAGQKHKLNYMKMELKQLLKQPVMSRQCSGKYPTKSGQLTLPYMQDFENTNAVAKVKADIKNTKTVIQQYEQNKAEKLKNLSKKKKVPTATLR